MSENLSPEKRIVQLAKLVRAAKQVLSDIDDNGGAERGDMGVLALRKTAALGPAEEIQSVVACARRVHSKFGGGSDWLEWAYLDSSDRVHLVDDHLVEPSHQRI